ncbi:MAG: hypothetical protein KAY50_00745 [Chitinophagaceae bacterium]|nr:hypothetical protein [Chitinophagaceae bacterium]
MQTTTILQCYDRTLRVKHVPDSEFKYRIAYGIPNTKMDDALNVLKEAFNINDSFPKSKSIELVYDKLNKLRHSDDICYMSLATDFQDQHQMICLNAIHFQSSIEFPLDLIIKMSKEHPYLGLCAGYWLWSIVHHFDVEPYSNIYGCDLDGMMNSMDNDSYSKSELKELRQRAKIENRSFKALTTFARLCKEKYYIDRDFSYHPFVKFVNKSLKELLSYKWNVFYNKESLIAELENKCIVEYYNDKSVCGSLYGLGLSYIISHDYEYFQGVNCFKETGTELIRQCDEFCGVFMKHCDAESNKKAIDALHHYTDIMCQKFYFNNTQTEWEKLSNLQNILSYTKMDTLKEGTLFPLKKKAFSGRRTLLEVLS